MKKPDHSAWGIIGTTKDPSYVPPPRDKYPGVDFEMDSRDLTLAQIKILDVDKHIAADMLTAEVHCKNRKTVTDYLRKIANG